MASTGSYHKYLGARMAVKLQLFSLRQQHLTTECCYSITLHAQLCEPSEVFSIALRHQYSRLTFTGVSVKEQVGTASFLGTTTCFGLPLCFLKQSFHYFAGRSEDFDNNCAPNPLS
eukprot:4235407-Amphidinium_carterae.2